ncbi:TPA: GGDEF domain-containing protein [Vibrio vulnificus]|uniref:GGDEF domain-containing protein n=1 Tax=Vibrio vulnificus TaxID=672 RepID=UPI0005F2239D|nr:GGDEF domain-containing protein [Vibrio vulnificus]ELK8587362.1 GGDEF domain-containing protein [Vibrio vulnificus]MCA3962763.1 GGDEF domain-containing protein [Vibrio vulnificus]MCJ0802845.1 GGDEF domain-containing protein [Vibrio vulnificus]MDK2623378.1 GGDEF domain-containing protein [Vibrio vulnificus]MDS1802485.1 GGDEF domain-containing protein [Vibrio vulnificus]
MDINELDGSLTLRLKVLKGMSLGIGSLAALMAIGNFVISQSYIYGTLEGLYALYSWHVYRQIDRGSVFNGHKYIMSLCITLLVILGTFLKPTVTGVFFWSLVLPIVYYLLLGYKVGFAATACLFLIQIVNITYQFYLEQYFDMLTMMINFAFCYFSIAAIAHVYEFNRVSTENKLSKLATLDPLTGTNNRLALKHRYQALKTQGTAFFLLVLDIDHFKAINDEYGHDGGDCVLRSVVKTMAHVVGEENVFRQGGEEFCILLAGVSHQQALKSAETIRQNIGDTPIHYREGAISVTVSIGLAEAHASSCVDEINRQADANLYDAKSQGRNRVVA